MRARQADVWRAYYCLHKLRKWPHEYIELPPRERGMVDALIDAYLEREK